MKNGLVKFISIAILLWLPLVVFSHIPKIVTTEQIIISNPELSQVFYDELNSKPRIYRLVSNTPFQLAISILVPKNTNPAGRYSLVVYHVNKMREKVGSINGNKVEWQNFHEPFANENYLQTPELNKQLHAGTYEVWLLGDNGKYALAIGSRDEMSISEIKQLIPLLLQLKKDFFNESPATFASSIIGGIYFTTFLLIGAAIAFLCFLVQRLIIKLKWIKYRNKINLNWSDRLLRLIISFALLLIGFDFWYAILFILAGFMLYEAIAGWCLFGIIL
jgi:hypothetical protein